MALYRTGTAAMDAQGVITGTGTKWREPLSLIRTGATIVFLTTPLKLAVISDIVSDTEMKAIQTDGEPVENGNYVILLNDSLTVDGMAQDVAETLRYYQSKETVIEEAIEFFKNFDLKTIHDLVARAEASAQKTNADRAATEQLKNDTDAIKNQTQQIKDSAVTEITGIKNEALDARDKAENAQFAAEQSKVGADNAKAGAETARDEARQWAQQVNPDNMLHKDQNLADVPDKEKAKVNFGLDRFVQYSASTAMNAGDYSLSLASNGEWGVYDRSAGVRKPLPIESGGTGGYNQYTARKALSIATDDVVWFKGLVAFDITGVGGAWTAVVRKLQDQAASDGANMLSYVENKWFSVQNYVAGAPGQQYQYVWSFNTFGGSVVWYSMRNDNGFYTPEGRCAIQGSDVRIKDRFEHPKPGAWDRVKQIGIMEFYYKGNHVLQRGYLAQQMAEIDDTYVFFGGTATDENGDEFEIMNVNDRAVISDLIVVVQELQKENEEMKEEIAEMKTAMAEMKAMLAKLTK